MANLTSDRRIAYPTRDLTPVPGHFLVVLERCEKGTEVRALLRPGERLGGALLERSSSLVAYAVMNGASLRHRFSRSYGTATRGEGLLFIAFDIDFEVADPVLLAVGLDSDPLRHLEDEIDALIRPAVPRERAPSFREELWAFIESRLSEIRSLASVVGFKVRNVSDLSLQEVRGAASREFRTQGAPIEFALQSERLDIRDLRGAGGIRPDYDYKALRAEDPHRS
ncbi:MAG: hypothetical protein WAM82_03640 [Thermoanaerobaculia bacterium]